MIDVFIKGQMPKTTHQAKGVSIRNGRAFMYKKPKAEQAECDLLSLLSLVIKDQRISGPVTLLLEVTWPFRKADLSTRAKRVACSQLGRIPNAEKPDCDNFSKAVSDALSRLNIIDDDKCIVELTVRKFHGQDPGLRVVISPAECDPVKLFTPAPDSLFLESKSA